MYFILFNVHITIIYEFRIKSELFNSEEYKNEHN